MGLRAWLQARLDRRQRGGKLNVVDPSPYNWLYITYNTVEELIRVSPTGVVEPAAMTKFAWVDSQTLDVWLRKDNRFLDNTPLDAKVVDRAVKEVLRWKSPHPPGTHFNLDQRTHLEVLDDTHIRFHLPHADGFAVGKLRAIHLMNYPFWQELGFGYKRNGTGEGHW